MKEIGGYIELDTFTGKMLHEEGTALNCGRCALEYLCEAKRVRKIYVPFFLCSSVVESCIKIGVAYEYYHLSGMGEPAFDKTLLDDEWLYIVNYYGQISNGMIDKLKRKYERIIVDNAQSYFQEPVEGVDTLYTCRKFFGVSDGAILFTDMPLKRELQLDESFERMHFLLGRYEHPASEFYREYVSNNEFFADQPIKKMSKLTWNILHGLNYGRIEKTRTENFQYLHSQLEGINRLSLTVPEGAFMYPLYAEDGDTVREQLRERKIYIPTLWPDVFSVCDKTDLEYDMAENILPLPVDQRYCEDDMKYIVEVVKDVLSKRT